jgi:alkanesulfonate monooxygenase SsuD/methylene tetrahydromethanopterin reductase-like flavin-dependent oxidoreductase (luciferase family)
MAGAFAAVDDDLVDAMALCGCEARVREKLAAYQEAGVDTVLMVPASPRLADQLHQVELLPALVS